MSLIVHCLMLVGGDDGDEAVPKDEGLINLKLSEEEAVEPLDAHDLEVIHLRLLLESLIEPEVDLLEEFLEFMCVLLSIEYAIGCRLEQVGHYLLEGEEGIALGNSPEVLAVLIGVGVEDEGCKFIHALRVSNFGMLFEVDVDDAGEAVVVEGLLLVFLLGEVELRSFEIMFFENFRLEELDLGLLLEELAVWLGSDRILLDHVPEIFVVEEVLPLGFLQ
jgi:hypothetical protein